MSVISIQDIQPVIYIILGIDKNEHDQVIAAFKTYDEAKKYCVEFLMETDFYDLWIEKHPLM